MFRLRWPANPGGVFARCFSADVFPPFENGLASVQLGVGWLKVVQALNGSGYYSARRTLGRSVRVAVAGNISPVAFGSLSSGDIEGETVSLIGERRP